VLSGAAPLTPPQWIGLHPSAATRFVGRQTAMWETHSALHAGDLQPMTGAAGPCVAQLCGLGGIGKTLLAQEYALRFGAAFPGGVLWLRAGGDAAGGGSPDADVLEATRASELRALATGLGLDPAALSAPDEVSAALGQALGERGEPFLWVVDDVPAGLDADALRAWFAPHPLGRTLITTRSRAYGALAATIEPSQLSLAEAVELLTLHREPRGGEEQDEARRLVEELGCHALAVDVAGAALARSSHAAPFAAFRAQLADPADDVLEFAAELADVLPTGHSPSIAATLLGGIEQLSVEARDVLRVAAVLAAAPIPATFIARVLAEAAEIELQQGHRLLSRARGELQRASLAEPADDGAADVAHALVARTVRFAEPGPDLLVQLEWTAIAVLNELGSAGRDPEQRIALAPLIPHARHLAQLVAQEPAGLTLLEWLADYDHEDGAYASAYELVVRAVRGREATLGASHGQTLAARGLLAHVLWSLGRFEEACAIEQDVLEGCRATLGEDDPSTLIAMNNLAESYRALGETAKALELVEAVVAARRKLLGPEHRETLIALGNLGEVLRSLERLDEVLPLNREVLRLRTRTLGERHPDTLLAKTALALTLRTLGQLSEARALDEEVVEARRATRGDDHPDTLLALGGYAETLQMAGEYAQALAIGRQLVDAHVRTLGAAHPFTLNAMTDHAMNLLSWDELDEAGDLLVYVCAEKSRQLGDAHPQTLQIRARLAALRCRQDRPEEARALLEGAYEATRRAADDEQTEMLGALGSLAASYGELGELDRACEIGAEAIELMERQLGSSHPGTLRTRLSQALMTEARGEPAEALRMAEAVYADLVAALGTEHPDTRTARHAVRRLRRTLGQGPSS
jgi:tetratricopeptide (TPR) repeat protein